MLPGIRFIFVTVILSASVLIFGLGAAALLRVSHEEFATLPSATLPPWRTAQSQLPPVPVETSPPTLAMLRIETPDAAKADEAVESPDPTPSSSLDAGPNTRAAPDKSNVTTETAPQPEARETSAEKSTDFGDRPDPVPADSPAPDSPTPSAVAAAPAPATEKQEDGTTGSTDSGSTKSEAVAPEAQADQSKAIPEKSETANIQIAKIDASEPNVAIMKTTEATGREVKLRMIKVHATKAKPVAKKGKRSGIYAMAQRRRAAARARAIARARAAQIAQQRLAAMNPFAALFGVPVQPAEVVHTPHQ